MIDRLAGAAKHQIDVAETQQGAAAPVSLQVVFAEPFRGAEPCLGHAKHYVMRLHATVVCLGPSEGWFVL